LELSSQKALGANGKTAHYEPKTANDTDGIEYNMGKYIDKIEGNKLVFTPLYKTEQKKELRKILLSTLSRDQFPFVSQTADIYIKLNQENTVSKKTDKCNECGKERQDHYYNILSCDKDGYKVAKFKEGPMNIKPDETRAEIKNNPEKPGHKSDCQVYWSFGKSCDCGYGEPIPGDTLESDDKDRQLAKAREQLEEANKALKSIHNNENGCVTLVSKYNDKYLKPVDERVKRFKELMRILASEYDKGYLRSFSYEKFNELFPKDNGTRGLKILYGYLEGRLASDDDAIREVWRDIMRAITRIKKDLES